MAKVSLFHSFPFDNYKFVYLYKGEKIFKKIKTHHQSLPVA